jgi:hypothetical protein
MNRYGTDAMTTPEKNLQAAVPPALLELEAEVAQQENITLDELVSEAMERRLNRREFEEVLAFGKRHAKALGLQPSDVESAIATARAEPGARVR